MNLLQLKRIRWGVRLVLVLGVAASVTANVLHARPNVISQVIAAWPPLALLLTVELISRVPVHRRSLAAVRLGSTAIIAGIAAWVSYWHMAATVARYGETGAAPYLMPFSVDGLVVVASVCLVELAGHIRATVEAPAPVAAEPIVVEPVVEGAPPVRDTAPAIVADTTPDTKRTAGRTPRRTPTAVKVAKLAAKMPDADAATIAAKVGVSARTVRRHLAAMATDTGTGTAAVNGHASELVEVTA